MKFTIRCGADFAGSNGNVAFEESARTLIKHGVGAMRMDVLGNLGCAGGCAKGARRFAELGAALIRQRIWITPARAASAS